MPETKRGKVARSNGKLIIIDPVADYYNHYETSPCKRKSTELPMQSEPEYLNDDYYLFYPRVPLLDDFSGSTPAFDALANSWDDDKTQRFRKYITELQSTMISLNAIVHLDVPEYGSRYCFHLRTCLERVREKYPSIK